MEPRIDQTQFGSVTIEGEVFTHDLIIRLAPGAGVQELEQALTATNLAVAELVGTYER